MARAKKKRATKKTAVKRKPTRKKTSQLGGLEVYRAQRFHPKNPEGLFSFLHREMDNMHQFSAQMFLLCLIIGGIFLWYFVMMGEFVFSMFSLILVLIAADQFYHSKKRHRFS